MRDNHAMIQIRVATAADRSSIVSLVVWAGLVPTGLDWRRFLVACDGEWIVGCVQVRVHHDGRELSSMVVAQTHRHRGIASRLVNALLAWEVGDLYLLCAERLRNFYARFGFVEVDGAELPEMLRRKRAAGRFFGLPVICMRRFPSDASR